jgi:general secretion pathway protein L
MTAWDFLRWWAEQLAASWPAALRGRGAKADSGTTVALVSPAGAPPVVEVTQPPRKRGGPRIEIVALTEADQDAARAAFGPRPASPVRLRLPRAMLLEREVVLPIAAERAPDQVLQYELDRLTPFRPDELLWGFEVTQRDRARGRLCLLLTFVPLRSVAPLLDGLRRIGVVPDLLEAEAAPGEPGLRRIALGRPGARHRRGLRTAWLTCAVLAGLVVVVPFIQQSMALGAVQTRIDALRPTVTEAEGLRQRAAAAASGGNVMQAEAQRLGDPLQALAAATEALPDDTWVTDLSLHQRKLILAGQSQDAVRLIGRLSSEGVIRNPSFTAPVTKSQTGRGDLYSIGAELSP